MNPQERAELQNFLDQLEQVHGIGKIAEADAMIKRAVNRQPDAAYLLVQRALLLGRALNRAKARIAELEQAQQESNRSFLDSTTPSSGSAASSASPSPMAVPGRPPSGATSSVQPAAPPSATPPVSPVSAPGGAAAGFLGQAAATAAGVAGGAFLFEGIESLLGHHGAPAPGYEAAPTLPEEDVTINNYYVSGDRPDETSDSWLAREDADDASDVDSDFTSDDDNFV
jgi:hypothetical protein